MSIFANKAGERVKIKTGIVTLEFLGATADAPVTKSPILFDMVYEATATDQYQMCNGERRRLYVDASMDFGFGTSIWLSDGPDVDGFDEPKADEWPDALSDVSGERI